ncbi:MAG: sigma-70 family RNA polymerase sigma factor [Desulfobacteraceae bacterium]|nr:sigma-70 family RNA polymerase sigma factor [Desulfobacteraceae bacterium]
MFNKPDEKTTSEDLMGRIRLGDKHAFEVLIHRHQQSVLNFIFRFMGDPTEAEDLTQEVFLRVWKAAGTYRPDAKFTTWLYRIATNLCINKQRAIRINRLFAPSHSQEQRQDPKDSFITDEGAELLTPEDRLIDSEQSVQLLRALNKLPTSQRFAIVLKIYDEMSYQEIAQIMDRSVSAVDSLLIRAKKNLREKLTGKK